MKTLFLLITLLTSLNVLAQRDSEEPLEIKKSLLKKALNHDQKAMEKIYKKYDLERDTAYLVMDNLDYVHFNCTTAFRFDDKKDKTLFDTDGFKENSAQIIELESNPQKNIKLYSLCERARLMILTEGYPKPSYKEMQKHHLNAYLLINEELIPINTRVEYESSIRKDNSDFGKYQVLEISNDVPQAEQAHIVDSAEDKEIEETSVPTETEEVDTQRE